MIIAFEGIDGAGKATQADKLYRYLDKKGFVTDGESFPDYVGPYNELAEAIEGSHVVTDYFRQHFYSMCMNNYYNMHKDGIMDEHEMVIMNRWQDSTMVYGTAQGIDVWDLQRLTKQLPSAKITFYLDITEMESNIRTANEHGYEDGFLDKVNNIYRHYSEFSSWTRIDGTKPEDEIHEIVKKTVNEYIAKHFELEVP